MFILKRQDVEISNIRHPQKDQQIPILSYQGQTFTLLNVFNASQAEEARALWRDLTDNRGKACVLLEEPERFSVWGKVRLDALDGVGDAVLPGGGGGAAQAAYVQAAILLLQAIYFDIEDLLGDRQGTKFIQDIATILGRLQVSAYGTADAVGKLMDLDPFEATLPSLQEVQVLGLLQELHNVAKVYFGNANFTGRAISSLQDMNAADLSQFKSWVSKSPLAKLWS